MDKIKHLPIQNSNSHIIESNIQSGNVGKISKAGQQSTSIYNAIRNKNTVISTMLDKCASRCFDTQNILQTQDNRSCVLNCKQKFLGAFESGLEIFDSYVEFEKNQGFQIKENAHSLY